MTEDQAYGIMERHLGKLARAIMKSVQTYRTRYPHRPIHRRTTIANVLCDEIWAEIINTFADDVPAVRPIPHRHNLRLMGVCGRRGEVDILLWFKKVDGSRKPRSYPTETARRRLAGGTMEMFEEATLLIVGYKLSRDETRVARVSIMRPGPVGPEWFIDIELPEDAGNVRVMPRGSDDTSESQRVVIRRTRQPRLVESE